MQDTRLENLIDCSTLSANAVKDKINDLFLQNFKQVILKNANGIENLLEGFSAPVKIEILDSITSKFSNHANGLKFIINGNVGNDSANYARSAKYTVFGSCGDNLGKGSTDSEYYILGNCGSVAFSSKASNLKVVIGGKPSYGFAFDSKECNFVILNLKGGKLFIDERDNWLKNISKLNVFVRGEVQLTDKSFQLVEVNEYDEDIYLPLISEFARLFKCSLSEIKSKSFYRLIVKL